MSDFQPVPDVPPPAHPPPGWGGGPALALRLKIELAVMLFATAAPSFVIGLRGLTDPEDIEIDEIAVLDLVAGVLAALGPAAIAIYLLWRDGRLTVAGFARRPLRWTFGYGALGAVVAVLVVWTIGIALFTIAVAVGSEPGEGDPIEVAWTAGVVITGLLLALAAGLGEEIVYRAYAISRLEELGWVRAAVWLPWAVFTVQHLYQGPTALLVIGGVAGTFVWFYRWLRSVWPVVVAHFLYDAFIIFVVPALS